MTFWDEAAATKVFTHPLDGGRFAARVPAGAAILLFAVLTCVPSDDAQRRLVAELRRVLRPGGLLLVSDYPLQADARNVARYAAHAAALGYGAFPVANGAVVRHHRESWFVELLDGFSIEETVAVDGRTMNGHPARLLQIWARRLPDPP